MLSGSSDLTRSLKIDPIIGSQCCCLHLPRFLEDRGSFWPAWEPGRSARHGDRVSAYPWHAGAHAKDAHN